MILDLTYPNPYDTLAAQWELGVMANSVFNAKALQDEAAAYRWVEAQIWPEGPVCPHCGGVDRISTMKGK